MNNFITEELQRIKLLSNYDNSKTLSEQRISKRERQLNNYYTKNSSNVKQIQTKLQELGLNIGASKPDGILGKSTLASILYTLDLVNAPKDFIAKGKDGNQTAAVANQPETGTNQTNSSFGKGISSGLSKKQSTGENPTVATANKPDNKDLPDDARGLTKVNKQTGP